MKTSGGHGDSVDAYYKQLLPLYLSFTTIWIFSAITWNFITYTNRHFQPNKLQWMLSSVPWIKALQCSLAFLFWHSCFHSNVCSIWMSFGVYIMGIIFQTSVFVSFFLISHGYCITCHRLSLSERRTIAVLGCVFYLTLVGHRASVPYFTVLLLLNYLIVFYVIFNHVSQNLIILREQLSFIEDDDVHTMHDAVYTKYIMFKKFQAAMHIVAVSELAIFISMDNSVESYWIRLLVREWAQFLIYSYIGWIFRSQELVPRFSVMPVLRTKGVPPIYSIEMDAKMFKELTRHEWHIGVPTLPYKGSLRDSVIVVVQQPHAYSLPSKS